MPPAFRGDFAGSGASGTRTNPALVQTSWSMPVGMPVRTSMTPCAAAPSCCPRHASSNSASVSGERAEERSERMATGQKPARGTISP